MIKPTNLESRIESPRSGDKDVQDIRENSQLEISGTGLTDDEISPGKYRVVNVNDAKLTKVIASNIVSDQTSLVRCVFQDCYLTGLHIPDGYLQDTVFEACKINLGNFRKTKLKRVLFKNCDLTETDFVMSELDDLNFEQCELGEVDFSNCKMKNVAFPQSSLVGINGIIGLKGAIVTQLQLIELAPLIGVEIGLKIID